MKLTPDAIRALAETARELGALAPAVASIFERLADDPAMSAISKNPNVDWLSGDDVQTIANFTAQATLFVNAISDNAKAAKKASRKPAWFNRVKGQ